MIKAPSKCPVCGDGLTVTKLICKSCGTALENDFMFNVFERLSSEQTEFVLEFLRCDGSIKEMERVLGISYPTVKNRLADVKIKLNLGGEKEIKNSEILDMITRGEISVDEATRILRKK